MGTWGIEVLEDDLTLDVYSDFIDLYNEKVPLPEIHRLVVERYSDCFGDRESHTKVWLGLAIAEWECRWLQPETYEELQHAISQGDDLSLWPLEERSERAKVLSGLLIKLKEPPKKARRRYKHKIPGVVFEPGSCLAINLLNGYWGAAIVLAIKQTPYDTVHLIGGLRGNFIDPPSMDIFEKREWEVMTHHNWKGTILLNWCGSSNFKQDTKESFSCIRVGETVLRANEPTLDNPLGIGSSWFCVENGIRLQYAWDASQQ